MDGSSGQYSVFNSAPAPDLMTGVTNGLGATAAWSHLPLSPYLQTTYAANPNLPACTEALLKACAPCAQAPLYTVNLNDHPPGYTRFSSSMWVASRFDQSNGLSGSPPNTTCYRYQDAMLNILGRGFQGFRKIIAEDRLGPAQGEPATTSLLSVNNLRTTMEFNQVFPFSNTAKRVTVQRQSDGAVLNDTVSWWQAVPGSTSGTWAVYASASEARRFDPDAGVQMDATANNLVSFAMSRKLTVVDGYDAPSGETKVSCSFGADYLQDRTQRGAPVNRPAPLSSLVSRETKSIFPPTLDWWLGRVDATASVSDRLASTAYPSLAARPDTTTMAQAAICPTVWSAEAKSQSATYTYYQTGTRRLQSAAVASSTGVVESTTSYSYDGFGNLAATSTTARDIPGTLQTLYGVSADFYFVETEVNPLGHVKTSRKSASNGFPVFEQAVQGAPAKSTNYDYLGRVLSVAVDGSRPLYQRLAACGGPSCGSARLVRQTLQGGAPTITEYLDEQGRAIQVTKDGFVPGSLVSSEVSYNERGLKLSESQPHLLTDSVYWTSYSGFDVLGRAGRKTVQRDSSLFANSSVGLPLAVTDYVQDGFKTHVYAYKPGTQSTPGISPAIQMSRTYDSGGRLVETTQLDDRGGTGPIRASYLYDPAGHLTHIIDLAGNDIAATYDDFGRKLQVSDPDRGVWTYAWDGLGRLERETDARGVKQSFTYDAIGRTTHRGTTSSGGVQTGESDWTYDLDGQVGVLSSIQTAPGYYVTDAPGFFRRFTYDQLQRPIQVTTTIRGDDVFVTSASGQSRTFVQQFAYDANYGRLKLRTTSSALGAGEAWALDYDGNGELLGETRLLFTSTVSRDKQYRLVTGMSARGQVTDQRLGNCIEEVNTFDASTGLSHMLSAMRPLNATSLPMTIAGASCSAAADLVRQDLYDYDHFLNLHQYTKQISRKEFSLPNLELHEVFGYDDLQRMTSAARCTGAGCAPGTPDTFGFDDLGNIRSKSDFATGYNYRTGPNAGGLGGPHAVSSVTKLDATVASYSYDANGNMVSGDGRTLTFDLMDRPVVVTQGTTTTEFAYAADGSRYRQVVKGNSTYGPRTVYSVDKDYELVVWLDGTIEERTYIGPSVVVQTSRASVSSPVVRSARYQLVDRLGSVQASTDETPLAALLGLDVHDFDAWGKPRAWDESSTGGSLHLSAKGVTTDRGFTGHEHLDAHQLIHMNGRIYDYNLGRFLSVDPIISNPANPQSINPYSYIGNNPLSGTDPTGYEENFQEKERVSPAAKAATTVTGSHIPGARPIGNLSIAGFSSDVLFHKLDALNSERLDSGTPKSGAVGAEATQHNANAVDQGAPGKVSQQPTGGGNATDRAEVGHTTVGQLAKVMSNEDRSLSTPKGGDPDELDRGKTALANAILNNAELKHPAKVAPATGTATGEDAKAMRAAYVNRMEGGEDPVEGRSQYGTSHHSDLKDRSAGNHLPGAAGRETVYERFGPFKDSTSKQPTYIYIYNDPGH
jgi:RHS repeat-associated protein